jgi:hypothetical protein
MITQAKLAANRANAQKSTGPKTIEGKANSSRNAFKHGLYSKRLVIDGEDAAALDALKADLRAEHQPANQTEEILVNELAEQYWRLRRARRLEAESLCAEQVVLTHLAAIQRMMSSAERGFHKALTALRQLQKARGFVPQEQLSGSRSESASALGFVPQSDQNPELTCDGTSALARKRGVKPPATEPRPAVQSTSASAQKDAVASGFVPPPCPADEEIDPADWARAFEARRRVHAKL